MCCMCMCVYVWVDGYDDELIGLQMVLRRRLDPRIARDLHRRGTRE